MSLYVGATGADICERTSGIINANSAYTWMAWVDLVTDTNNWSNVYVNFGTAAENWTDIDVIGCAADGTTLRLSCFNGGSGSTVESTYSLSVGVPAHLAIVRNSATSLIGYLNGTSLGIEHTNSVSSRATTQREQIGSTFYETCPVRYTGMKQWQAALTAAEIIAEMRAIRPLRFADLKSWHPAIANTLTDALKDFSGNASHWTSVGTNSVESPTPPVSWGNSAVWIGNTTVTVQFLRPISDVSNSGWTPSSGSDLFAMLDETVRSDADYISATTVGATFEVLLGTVTDPVSSVDHLPRIAMGANSGGIILRLKQGTTTIKEWTYSSLTTSLSLYQPTLSGAEIDSITDYTNLRLYGITTA